MEILIFTNFRSYKSWYIEYPVCISLLIHAMIFGEWIPRKDIAGLLNKHILSLYIYWQAILEKALGIFIPTDSAPELISSLSPVQRLSLF